MTIQFDHFNPQSFERLVQALCTKILGSELVVFGSGPDGAREATFEGKVPYPSASEQWDGYIVIQAKCRKSLRHSREDARWLAQQLRHDLNKFLDTKRALRKPEYYILATNVTLSSVEATGGKAIIESVMKHFRPLLDLKSWAVWSADELRVHLENANDVRTTYTAWLTPSDVLSELIKSLKRPNLGQLLPLALSRDLRNERDVRLRDAGQETESPVFLDQTFVDLPLESADPRGIDRLAAELNTLEVNRDKTPLLKF